MARDSIALVLLLAVTFPACSSSSPSVDGSSGGTTGGGGSAAIPPPPVIGKGDGFCISEERFVTTCEWAAAAKRIVWARVKSFALVTEPSYLYEGEAVFAAECARVEPAGELTLEVIDDFVGAGASEVVVLIGARQIDGMNPTPRLNEEGELYWTGQTYPGLVEGQEFAVALHQPEGSDLWLLREEQFIPLDANGQLAGQFDDECSLYMPEVLSGGTLADLREELDLCDGKSAEPWLEELSVDDSDLMLYYSTARCLEGTPATGGAGGEAGGP